MTFRRDGVGVTAPVVSHWTASSTTDITPGIGQKVGSTKTYNHNGLKSVEAQSQSASALSSTRVYDAWGAVVSSTGTHAGRFGHGGAYGYQSDSNDLQLLGHRFYDPNAGRFLTRDRIKDGRNWYAYCDNNPLRRADPSGLAWHDPGIVYVSPEFDGYVIVFGEQQGDGSKQVGAVLRPGEHSNPHLDVDVIMVIHKDGTVKVYVFAGTKWPDDGKEDPQLAVVGASGEVNGNLVYAADDEGPISRSVVAAFLANLAKNLDPNAPLRYGPRRGVPPMAKYREGLNP